ncbi:AAA_4 multi-domain protein [Acidipropionibacterium acidipropionici ATCC 4875]|uniref:AAA_4 multi-domain protein n=1 Tax=Acidipropionibacterium acidipropionici (strain ATCC 4875 / DSM 20272 / JCM 6432 / NBRC 12425 / NCIMB 8070 / 4) TaxID=1171373 RepID=K7RUI1_ACIA4|nr:RNA-binding domain-containing protein [Acidipropionibacterium acidipropionici]AFV90071.1 AAA_4 multi-domain protein [Acidipropionibacterium acidipropionici ATCC 4875]
MVQQYLGPTLGVVSLSTWDEAVEAAEGGLLEESQWCELKEMATPPGGAKRDANVEMARDLASLSVDGGLLIYGVRDKDRAVVGCHITGLHDRIAQVAASRVHPPLSPNILNVLQHPEDETVQVLVVQVPPSPLAPHMVDGSYWGRSSNGKRRLDDAEVRRLLTQRDQGEEAFRTRLMEMESRDPLIDFIEEHPTGNGHVYLLAQPCAPVVRGDEDVDVSDLRRGIRGSSWPATIQDCVYRAHDPYGQAFMNRREPVEAHHERSLCWFSIKDSDSSIELVSGGGTATWEFASGKSADYLLAGLISTLTVQVLQLVNQRSMAWGYTGLWRVGVRVTNTRGAVFNSMDTFARLPAFAADDFVSTSVIQGVEGESLEQAKPLLKGLYRGLGISAMDVDAVAN